MAWKDILKENIEFNLTDEDLEIQRDFQSNLESDAKSAGDAIMGNYGKTVGSLRLQELTNLDAFLDMASDLIKNNPRVVGHYDFNYQKIWPVQKKLNKNRDELKLLIKELEELGRQIKQPYEKALRRSQYRG